MSPASDKNNKDRQLYPYACPRDYHVAATIYQREEEIINYFINRATNAATESLNAKIKNYRAQLHGVVDVDCFLYKLL